MNDASLREPIPFTPPTVGIAHPQDGLLKVTDLNSPVPVDVMVWPAAEPGYYFQLMLNGDAVGDIRIITEHDKAGDIVTVYLSETLLAKDGTYWLGYVATSPNTLVSDSSPVVPLKVDRIKPGAALLAPMIFPNPTLGDHLAALIPGYAGMEQGDVIQTLCNGVPGPTHTVQADELTIRPVEILFERAFLESLAAETASMEYRVSDRAGNQSEMSLPVTVSVKL